MGHSVLKPPYFFLSYVHDSGDDDASIRGFYDKLTHDVRLVSGERTAHIGFCDVALRAGDRWSAELVRNLSTAQVFLPIVSPTYFASPACGKEWAVFTSRKVGGGPPQAVKASLIPLFWIPMPNPPAVLQPYQYRDPAFGEVYARYGLRALTRMTAHRDAYHAFVQALAERIVHLYDTVHVTEALARPKFDEVDAVFPDPVPPRQRQHAAAHGAAENRNQMSRKPQVGMPRLNPADPWPKDERR